MLTYDVLSKRLFDLLDVGHAYMKKLYNRALYEPEFDSARISPCRDGRYVAYVTLSIIEHRIRAFTLEVKYGVLPYGGVITLEDRYSIAMPYSGILDEWLQPILFELRAPIRAKKFVETIKEELVAKAWAPERVSKWLEAGVALELL